MVQPRTWWLPTLLVVGNAAAQIHYHNVRHGVFNAWQIGLALFLSVDVFVCLAEIQLYLRGAYIASRHRALRKQFGGGDEMTAVWQWFVQPLTLRSLLGTTWADMWATYALFDDHYADDHSYPYFVDCGNGVFMLLPTLLLLCGMTNDLSSIGLTPRLLGLVSLLAFWTQLYGTVMYIWTFYRHKRYEPAGVKAHLIMWGFNSLWLVAPSFGCYAAWTMILSNDLKLFLH